MNGTLNIQVSSIDDLDTRETTMGISIHPDLEDSDAVSVLLLCDAVAQALDVTDDWRLASTLAVMLCTGMTPDALYERLGEKRLEVLLRVIYTTANEPISGADCDE